LGAVLAEARTASARRRHARVNPITEISPYDRLCWPEGQLECALATGRHRRELIAYFGEREYQLLAGLARSAERARRRRSHATAGADERAASGRSRRVRLAARSVARVYLLPGLMGSQLGWPRAATEPPELLWLDPFDIVHGGLTALHWPAHVQHPADPPLTTLGVIPHTYLALKLRLIAAGFEVVMYDYDWRADLGGLAHELAARLGADPAGELVLLGHSMGGLLARAALARLSATVPAKRIRRVILLGTPHAGSIGAVQALRATYPLLLRLAAMDREHDAPALTRGVFRSFASLYQMLPEGCDGLDLFAPAHWPGARRAAHASAAPDARLLEAAREFRRTLVPPDERQVCIVGTGQRTVTGLMRIGAQFRYEVSSAGDGTVAAASATLPGAQSYSLRCEHSELPRSERVAAAIVELARRGDTAQLPAGVRARKGRCVYVTDTMLRNAFAAKLDWHHLTAAARRRYMNRLNAPPALYHARARPALR
jgi:pimeloyl-ACP methyl ester carboxylesterase